MASGAVRDVSARSPASYASTTINTFDVAETRRLDGSVCSGTEPAAGTPLHAPRRFQCGVTQSHVGRRVTRDSARDSPTAPGGPPGAASANSGAREPGAASGAARTCGRSVVCKRNRPARAEGWRAGWHRAGVAARDRRAASAAGTASRAPRARSSPAVRRRGQLCRSGPDPGLGPACPRPGKLNVRFGIASSPPLLHLGILHNSPLVNEWLSKRAVESNDEVISH